MIYVVLQNGIVGESWSISLGMQPSQPADAIRTYESSAGEEAKTKGQGWEASQAKSLTGRSGG
jgi:hypothetical protein